LGHYWNLPGFRGFYRFQMEFYRFLGDFRVDRVFGGNEFGLKKDIEASAFTVRELL
jgi:hypothetical protein